MDEMSRKRIEVLRKQYPAGCMVELVSMDDVQAPPKGTKGVVLHIDDIGSCTSPGRPARRWAWCRASTSANDRASRSPATRNSSARSPFEAAGRLKPCIDRKELLQAHHIGRGICFEG